MRAETWFIPAMSTTEYIIVTSTAPTYGRVSPDAIVETISFGTPTGSARIACVAIAVPPEPPSAGRRRARPSACRRSTTRPRAARHRLDGGAAVAGLRELVDVRAGGGARPLARYVGLGERQAEDARVHEHAHRRLAR